MEPPRPAMIETVIVILKIFAELILLLMQILETISYVIVHTVPILVNSEKTTTMVKHELT